MHELDVATCGTQHCRNSGSQLHSDGMCETVLSSLITDVEIYNLQIYFFFKKLRFLVFFNVLFWLIWDIKCYKNYVKHLFIDSTIKSY